MKRLLLAISLTLVAEEVKKQPLAVSHEDRLLLKIDRLELENLSYRREAVLKQYHELDKQLKEAQQKLNINVERVRKLSGADGFKLNLDDWTWEPQKPVTK